MKFDKVRVRFMEIICPVCNGLTPVDALCPQCGRPMQDGGPVDDYLGSYSPYMEKSMWQEQNYCVHLLYCPDCHYDVRAAWEMVIV
mgnify:CR=1 FL=1